MIKTHTRAKRLIAELLELIWAEYPLAVAAERGAAAERRRLVAALQERAARVGSGEPGSDGMVVALARDPLLYKHACHQAAKRAYGAMADMIRDGSI
ncbi:hypothetical protein ACWEN6_13725 [Sphaerisporangium sp. NPDC004334]